MEEPQGEAVTATSLDTSIVGALAARARPIALAAERQVPVLAALEPLLPNGGLARGTVVTVAARARGPAAARPAPAGAAVPAAHAATSLALALAAGASAGGAWCAAVGAPSLGLVAAAEVGVALERFPLVAAPSTPGEWATVVATLLDAFDVVLSWPPPRLGAPSARRLVARARERGAVLVACGGGWPFPGDVRLAVGAVEWEGLGQGHGHLVARRVEVVAGGRGAVARERRGWLWLPAADGGVASAPAPAAAPSASSSAWTTESVAEALEHGSRAAG